jgi:hypothetical protein
MDKPPRDDEICAFTEAALGCLPISWKGLVVDGQYHESNPANFDSVLELFGADQSSHLTQQNRANSAVQRPLLPECAPQASVLSGRAFVRHYDSPTHRTLFVMTPWLASDNSTGLLVVQFEDAKPSGALVTDHWIFMRRDEKGRWQRQPIPAPLKERLYLTTETGG